MHEPRELYEQVILDHNRNPRNFMRRPEHSSHQAAGDNPICGDEFSVSLRVEDGRISDIGFNGVGCAISVASTSLMTEAVKGKTVAEARALFQSMRGLLTGGPNNLPPDRQAVGKLRILAGVRDYPMRVKCATLPWHILDAALRDDPTMVCTERDSPPPEECRLPPAA